MKWLLILFMALFVAACGSPMQTNGVPRPGFGTVVPTIDPIAARMPTADMSNATPGPPPTVPPFMSPTPELRADVIEVFSAPPACPNATSLGFTDPQYLHAIARFRDTALQVEGEFIEGSVWARNDARIILADRVDLLPAVTKCS